MPRHTTTYRKTRLKHERETEAVRAELLKASKDDATLKTNAAKNAKRYK